tara:strand:- start:43 stop:162 length:120 start_codon:yes stop_codon:yes gene_type:complete
MAEFTERLLLYQPMSMPNNEAESKSFTMLIPKLGLKMVV